MGQELYGAWLAFRKGKHPSRDIDAFEYALETNLRRLAHDIETREYRHGNYKRVTIQEKKRRDLAVAAVRDRVIHRLIYDKLVTIFDPTFDPDVWSCRIGKGLHRCLNRTIELLTRYPNSYIWRMDATKFFDSVDHAKLREFLRRRVRDKQTLWLCDEIIRSYHVGDLHGIPLGNLTSQVFANIYLNEFDRYVRHVLKPQAYARYGDDAILFARTRHEARDLRSEATVFLKGALKLTISPKSDVIIRADQPLHWLGHVVTDKCAVVDKYTTRSVLRKVNLRNVASYKSLNLAKWPKRELDWRLLDEVFDIY